MLDEKIKGILDEVEEVLQKHFICTQKPNSFYVSLKFDNFICCLSYAIFEQIYAKHFDNLRYKYDFVDSSKMAKEKTVEEIASFIEDIFIKEFSKKIKNRGNK